MVVIVKYITRSNFSICSILGETKAKNFDEKKCYGFFLFGFFVVKSGGVKNDFYYMLWNNRNRIVNLMIYQLENFSKKDVPWV